MEYIANSMEKRVTAVSRQSNYDFLRFLAMMGVIINHVSDIFVFRNGDHLLTTYIWEGAGAFAVPAFLMISGSFLIDKESTANALEFYKKSFRKIGLHTIIFSCFYFFRVLLMKLRASSGIAAAFSAALRFQLTGWTGHPLWFVYSLAGIYCILPILASLKKKYGAYKEYHVFAMLYCVWAFLSLYFEQLPMSWSTGSAFGYLGFVILGNEIHTFVSEKGNNAGGYVADCRLPRLHCTEYSFVLSCSKWRRVLHKSIERDHLAAFHIGHRADFLWNLNVEYQM